MTESGRKRGLAGAALVVACVGLMQACGGKASSRRAVRNAAGGEASVAAPTLTEVAAGQGGYGSEAGAAPSGAAVDPCPQPVFNAADGIVTCGSDYEYRLEQGQGCGYAPLPDQGEEYGCDPAQCTERAYGYCYLSEFDDAAVCQYACITDADCGPSQVCFCRGLEPGFDGVCVEAGCRTDADCEPGRHCVLSPHDDCEWRFECESARDECVSNADCAIDEACQATDAGFRRCEPYDICE